MGSANFDVLSYRFQQEFMAIVTDPRLVEDFRNRVVEVDLRRSAPCQETHGLIATRFTEARLGALDRISELWRWVLPAACALGSES